MPNFANEISTLSISYIEAGLETDSFNKKAAQKQH